MSQKYTIFSGQSIGAGSVSVTPSSTIINPSTDIFFSGKITNGSTAQTTQGSQVILYYSSSPFAIANGSIVSQQGHIYKTYINLQGLSASGVKYIPAEMAMEQTGDTIYFWADGIGLDGSVTLDLVAYENETADIDNPVGFWQYATPIASPITNTTPVALKAAAGAGVRNYLNGLQYHNTSATPSIVTVQDGSTVIFTCYAPASMTYPAIIEFETPLKGSANTALNFVVNTTSTNTFVSAQGYIGQ